MKTILNKITLAAIAAVLLGASACREKNNEPVPISNGSLTMKFEHTWGSSQAWEPNKTFVHARTNDTLTFTMLKYYISNIRLQKSDETWWSQPNSYYLVDASTNASPTITITDVPGTEYIAMQYTIGVDSARNVSGAQTGALSVINGMFWDWNTGYIMAKAEGTSPNANTVSKTFAIHLGGFAGPNKVVTTKNIDFRAEANRYVAIGDVYNPTMTVKVDVASLWKTSPGVGTISTLHMEGPQAATFGKDFFGSFSFSNITLK